MSRWWLAALAMAATFAPLSAGAYEFELLTRTVGQSGDLRSLRVAGPDLILARRRFTQTLALHVWNIGQPHGEWWRLYDPEPPRGPRISFQTYVRLDHDFGDYTGGELFLGTRSYDAIDLVPELESSSMQLDVLYAVLAAEGLAGGRVDLYAGRQLVIESLDWYAFDGGTARVRTPWHVAGELFGGLQVRDSSPLGSATFEPDGTSAGECQEYVEGTVPGSGAWRPIDLGRPGDSSRFRNDLDVCPQRDEWMPAVGGALALADAGKVSARVSYRKSISRTPGVIAGQGRGGQRDLGLYPNEIGQAPGWGTNQEHASIEARAPIAIRRPGDRITPYAAARYSLLHGLIDQALAGARLRLGPHAVEPEVYYSFPTFDGDSIFNVFSVQPYVDSRLTYELSPRGAPWNAYARGWIRRFRVEDAGRAAPGADVDTGALAGGGQTGGRWVIGPDRMARVDLFHEGGYGGRRTGGFGLLSWRVLAPLVLSTRVSVIDAARDLPPEQRVTTLGVQAGATCRIHDGMAVSLVAEETTSAIERSQLAVFFLLDLAFRPEL